MIFDYIDLLINLIGVMILSEGIDIDKIEAKALEIAIAVGKEVGQAANNREKPLFPLVLMTSLTL